MVILLIVWLTSFAALIAYCNAQIDSVLYITYRKKITHWTRALVRIALMSISSLVPFRFLDFDWVFFLILLSYSGVVFWILFEYWYNKWIGQKTDYIGTTAEIDKLQRKIFGMQAGKWNLFFKMLFLCICIEMIINR
jgi:hypothetical protein